MKFYIAARFSRRTDAHALSRRLIGLGHIVVSRWAKPDSDHVLPVGLSECAADAQRRRFAMEDLEDVQACDCLVALMEPDARNNSRGGRHVEFGYAMGLGKSIVVIGNRETIFHHLDAVWHYENVNQFVEECRYGKTDRL